MMQKYLRIEFGTGYCGEDEVDYYLLQDQTQTELTAEDWERYQSEAIAHNESFGRDFADWCDENGLDPDEDDGTEWDTYATECAEAGSMEIVEIDSEDSDAFADGHLIVNMEGKPFLW